MKLAPAAALAIFAIACGGTSGNPDRVLQIGGMDRTESEWRTSLRAGALLDTRFCRSFDGLSGIEASDLLAALLEREGVQSFTSASLKVTRAELLFDLADITTDPMESAALRAEAFGLLDEADVLLGEARAKTEHDAADMNRLAAIVQEECRRLE